MRDGNAPTGLSRCTRNTRCVRSRCGPYTPADSVHNSRAPGADTGGSCCCAARRTDSARVSPEPAQTGQRSRSPAPSRPESKPRGVGPPRCHVSSKAGEGQAACAKRVHASGLAGKQPRRTKLTTNSNHPFPIAANVLNREFQAARPNAKWVADITYVATAEGWLYLAVVMDVFSRRIIGWSMQRTLACELVLAALHMALRQRGRTKQLIHHSDRGSQYASQEYQAHLAAAGIRCSMSRRGNCFDNAVVESFFGTLKTELVYHHRGAPSDL